MPFSMKTDSGLDIDALKWWPAVNSLRGPNLACFDHALSTFVELHRPDFVHVMVHAALCAAAERNWRWNGGKGYDWIATTQRTMAA